MKCPMCSFHLEKGQTFCECGYEKSEKGGYKKYTPHAADSLDFQNQSIRSKMRYLKDIGGFGGYSEKD